MKMNSLKIYSIILFLGLITGSCEVFTEPGKDNQYTSERVMKDPAFAEGILLNGYISLPNSYNINEDVGTDDAVSNDNFNAFRRMATGEWSSRFNPFDIWNSTYTAIFNLNYFLSIAENVEWSWQSPERNALFIKKFKGEAFALRGYHYHRLLVRYGGIADDNTLRGVPLVTTPISINEDWKVPRATYQATVNQIMADYDAALALLPDEWLNISGTDDATLQYNRVNGTNNALRINGLAVKALKARLALHIASPAFNNGSYDLTKCETAAALAGPLAVWKGGIAGLPADYMRIYDADADITNTDVLWRNSHYTNNTLESQNYPPSLFGSGRINPTQNLVDAFPMRNGYPISHVSSGFNAASPYANRDLRLGYYVLCNGATLRSTVINTSINSTTSDGLNKLSGYSTRTGYYLLKWLRVNVNMNPAGTTTARHFYTHIRFIELYLIYAEAANEAWGPDADPNAYGFTPKTIIGQIRNRAGITQPDAYLAEITTKEQMRELIRNERRIIFSFEGHRFWDLRRWQVNLTEPAKGVSIDAGVYTPIDVENRAYPVHALYGPLPLQETLKYPGLLQNKGW
jgi:starch-binding outer membrane protein, SusD/RagB family